MNRLRTMAHIFAIPTVLAVVTAMALIAGLIGAEQFRPLVWLGLALPLAAAILFPLWRRR